MPRKVWVAGGVFLLVTAAGVLEALQLMLPGGRMSSALGEPDLWGALFYAVPSWWLLALLIPVGWWAGSRWPIVPRRWKRRVLIHVVDSLAFPLVLFGLVAVFYGAMEGQLGPSHLRKLVLGLVELYYVYYVVIYWLILGAVHVLRYYRSAKNHEIRELRLRHDLDQARLSALRAQLDPHFLFNSLNTIVGMALERGHEEVADAVTELSELLRVSLGDDRARLVRLGQELDFTRDYLSLQKHRFGDRLDFAFEVPEAVRDAMVPPMVLQPLVENAIEHGVLPGSGEGRVEVRARLDRDGLVLEVEDSGPGFQEGLAPEGGKGVGLANTRARLRQLFGDDGELSIGTAREGGARVTVRIPYVPADTPAEEVAGVLA